MKYIKTKIIIFSFLLVYVQSQCCVSFDANSSCIQCPVQMHLYNGNCLFDIDNCKNHVNGFDCDQCEKGFVLNDDKRSCEQIDGETVLIPSAGWKVFPRSSENQPPMQTLIQHSLENFGNDLSLHIALFVEQEDFSAYRLVFLTNEGFLQNTYVVLHFDDTFTLRNSSQFAIRQSETYINIFNDPNFETIKEYIEQNSEFSSDTIIEGFKSFSEQKYRVFLLTENEGIVQIEVEIFESGAERRQQINIEQQPNINLVLEHIKQAKREIKNSKTLSFFKIIKDKDTISYQATLRNPKNDVYVLQFTVDFTTKQVRVLKFEAIQEGTKIDPSDPTLQPITNITLEIKKDFFNTTQFIELARPFIQQYKQELVLGGQPTRGAIGSNDTITIIMVEQELIGTQNFLQLYFAHQNSELRLIRQILIPVNKTTITDYTTNPTITMQHFLISQQWAQQIGSATPYQSYFWHDRMTWYLLKYKLESEQKYEFLLKKESVMQFIAVLREPAPPFTLLSSEEINANPVLVQLLQILENSFFASRGIQNAELIAVYTSRDIETLFRSKYRIGDAYHTYEWDTRTFLPVLVEEQPIQNDQTQPQPQPQTEPQPQPQKDTDDYKVITLEQIQKNETLNRMTKLVQIIQFQRIFTGGFRLQGIKLNTTLETSQIYELLYTAANSQLSVFVEILLASLQFMIIHIQEASLNQTEGQDSEITEYLEAMEEMRVLNPLFDPNAVLEFEVMGEGEAFRVLDAEHIEYMFGEHFPMITVKSIPADEQQFMSLQNATLQITNFLQTTPQTVEVKTLHQEATQIKSIVYDARIDNMTYDVRFAMLGDSVFPVEYNAVTLTFGLSALIFQPPTSPSNSIITFMRQVYGNRIAVISEQKNVEEEQLRKVVVVLYQGRDKVGMEVIVDTENNMILRQYFMQEGFTPSFPDKQLHEWVMGVLSNYELGDEATMIKSLQRSSSSTTQHQLYYQFDNATIYARVLVHNQQPKLLQLKQLPSNLHNFRQHHQQQRRNYINSIIQQAQFLVVASQLHKRYKHVLHPSNIMHIQVGELVGSRVYTVHYRVGDSTFKTVLAYDYQRASASILSLSMPPQNIAFVFGCVEYARNYTCTHCEDGLYVGDDGKCYERINNCRIQSGEICVECQLPYQVDSHKCVYN